MELPIKDKLLKLLKKSSTYEDFEQDLFLIDDDEIIKEKVFDLFSQSYFATQKIFQCKTIHPVNELPKSWLNRLHTKNLKNKNVDGIFETTSDVLHLYHIRFVKKSEESKKIDWTELTPFFNKTGNAYCRVVLTNTDDVPRDFEVNGSYFVRREDLLRLKKQDLDNIKNWLLGFPLKYSRFRPKQHQRKAITQLTKQFKSETRLKLIMACGTGKSLIPLWYAEKEDIRCMLVLVPSLALLHQFLHTWIEQTKWNNFNFIAVCSDKTVTDHLEDAWEMHPYELDFPVTTEPEEVKRFLKSTHRGPKVIFSTYQSAQVVSSGMGTRIFDLAVFDEAHKTAGLKGKQFSYSLEDKNLQCKRRLFMTATPRHCYLRKKEAEEAKVMYSMEDKSIYGIEAYRLTFLEAIEREIVCDYRIVISVVTKKELSRRRLIEDHVKINNQIISAKHLAMQIALKKAIDELDVRKVFTFHHTIKEARAFTGEGIKSIKPLVPNYECLHINGSMSTSKRTKALNKFRKVSKGILSNARCLTEGVDVPAVDMVAFMCTKRSTIDIVQAVGRAMRKAPGKHRGYIFIPLFLNEEINEDIEEAANRSDYEDLLSVMNALSESDEGLGRDIQWLRIKQGEEGKIDYKRLFKKTVFIGEKINIKKIEKIVGIKCLEKLGDTWNLRYGELKAYKKQYGDCLIPREFPKNSKLGQWVSDQRRYYKKGKLTQEKIAKLNELGFIWDIFKEQWQQRYKELAQYKKQHENCLISSRFPGSTKLGIWVGNQRSLYKRGKLTQGKIKKLNKLGFMWDILGEQWWKQYEELVHYKEQYGNCLVPKKSRRNHKLSSWVRNQRGLYKKGKLSCDKIEKLKELDFTWNVNEAYWQQQYKELVKYKELYGDCLVPNKFSENPKLSSWVRNQRSLYKKGALNKEKINELNMLGFTWDIDGIQWHQWYQELIRYKKQYGDCLVPQIFPKNSKLGYWVRTQRRLYRDGKLIQEKIDKLNNVRFIWEVDKVLWQQRYEELVSYREQYGNCLVPQRFLANPKLGIWVGVQRRSHKNGKLASDKVNKLERLGFLWNIDEQWQQRYEELVSYREQYGDCLVSSKFLENPKLSSWVRNQRESYKQGRLSRDKINKLESLGFIWDTLEEKWLKRYKELVQYKKEYGDCLVLQKFSKPSGLKSWVIAQRILYKKGDLTEERIKKLESLGFIWDVRMIRWHSRCEELIKYKEQCGNCLIPARFPENPELGSWVSMQRINYRKGILTQEKIKKLERLGFVWDPDTRRWQTGYQELMNYKKQYRDCLVPKRRFSKNFGLGEWVSKQRSLYKKGKLDKERIKKLEALGFVWSVKDN